MIDQLSVDELRVFSFSGLNDVGCHSWGLCGEHDEGLIGKAKILLVSTQRSVPNAPDSYFWKFRLQVWVDLSKTKYKVVVFQYQ